MRTVGPASSKHELVARSAHIDFPSLGRAYAATLPAGPSARVIDKTPGNFLYLALIMAALPQARIVHVRRHPMDACYAMFKTLFRMAYPFSYDLDDLGRYWLGYDRLMAHWRQMLPAERFLEVDYEALVDDQKVVSRALIAHAGLGWEDACLHFEHNQQPTLTASAAQVRQPIYRSSLGLWHKYEAQLSPLLRQLEHAGVCMDDRPGRHA
ncbi:MAG: sulfotransferase [Pseudoxanthomonas sp.]|nr:sulfotransferase [Pseudoxanthomonas sp.]